MRAAMYEGACSNTRSSVATGCRKVEKRVDVLPYGLINTQWVRAMPAKISYNRTARDATAIGQNHSYNLQGN